MLSHLALGILALVLLWKTTLLVAWAALREVGHQSGTSSPRAARVRLGVAGMLIVAASCTCLALWPPLFGPASTVGGVTCLGFFLLVQPLGTALRDYARAPSTRAPPLPAP